jgi:hypothetical protein
MILCLFGLVLVGQRKNEEEIRLITSYRKAKIFNWDL